MQEYGISSARRLCHGTVWSNWLGQRSPVISCFYPLLNYFLLSLNNIHFLYKFTLLIINTLCWLVKVWISSRVHLRWICWQLFPLFTFSGLQEVIVGPENRTAISGDNFLRVNLIGDFVGYTNIPSFEDFYLVIPRQARLTFIRFLC